MEHALDVLPVGARLNKVTEQPGVRHGRAGLRVELTRETVDAQDCVDSNTFVVLPVDFAMERSRWTCSARRSHCACL